MFRDPHYCQNDPRERVEELWGAVKDPDLVCALRVDHAITGAREEVEVVITSEGVTIHHRSWNPLLSSREGNTIHSARSPEELASELRALGILRLGSTEQTLYDGALAEIAAREDGAGNVFLERSVDTPQAEVRRVLLALVSETEPEREATGREEERACDESEMSFIVTTPKRQSEEGPGDG